jgi:CDP-diacylglycerol--serine O-phosphatidyltransferase
VPFVTVIVIAVVLALLAYQPPAVLFIGFVAYAVSGYVIAAWSALKRRRSVAP